MFWESALKTMRVVSGTTLLGLLAIGCGGAGKGSAGTNTTSAPQSTNTTYAPQSTSTTVLAKPVVGTTVFTYTSTAESIDFYGWTDRVAIQDGAVGSGFPVYVYDLRTGERTAQMTSDTPGLVEAVTVNGRDLLIALVNDVTPAPGVKPGSNSNSLEALSADDLSVVWRTPQLSSHALDESGDVMFQAGAVSTVGILQFKGSAHGIDLATGKLTWSSPSLIITEKSQSRGDRALMFNTADLAIVNTKTGAVVATVKGVSHDSFTAGDDITAVGDDFIVLLDQNGNSRAISMTDGSRLSTLSTDNQQDYVGDVAVSSSGEAGDGPITASSVRTGKKLWSVVGQLCGTSSNTGTVNVIANQQHATLDAKTGTQLSFDPNNSDCLPTDGAKEFGNVAIVQSGQTISGVVVG